MRRAVVVGVEETSGEVDWCSNDGGTFDDLILNRALWHTR